MFICIVATSVLVVSALSFPSPQLPAEKRQLDPDRIMADVYSNSRNFHDSFDGFKLSSADLNDVLKEFERFTREYPEEETNNVFQTPEPVKVLPKDDDDHVLAPNPHLFPKVKTRFFRMF